MTDKITPYQKKLLRKMANGVEPETMAQGPWTRTYRIGNSKQGINIKSLWKLQELGFIAKGAMMTDYGLREYYRITPKGKKAAKNLWSG